MKQLELIKLEKFPKHRAVSWSSRTMYTGLCFRRTSVTLLVNGGVDITQLKKHGGWNSTNIAQGSVDENITKKISRCEKIMG